MQWLIPSEKICLYVFLFSFLKCFILISSANNREKTWWQEDSSLPTEPLSQCSSHSIPGCTSWYNVCFMFSPCYQGNHELVNHIPPTPYRLSCTTRFSVWVVNPHLSFAVSLVLFSFYPFFSPSAQSPCLVLKSLFPPFPTCLLR